MLTLVLPVSLCLEIVEGYVALDEEHQQRNIVAWKPTLVEILDGLISFSDSDVIAFKMKSLLSSSPNI